MNTQRALLNAIQPRLDALGRGRRGPWSPHVRNSDITEHLAWSVVVINWPETPAVPRWKARIDPMTARALTEVIDRCWPEIVQLCECATAISMDVLATVSPSASSDQHASFTAGQIGERIAVRVAAAYRENARVPNALETQALTKDVARTLGEHVHPLSASDFAARAETSYEARWRSHGSRTLSSYPPSRVALGADVRPPLVLDSAEPTGAYRRGPFRSVYRRYLLHYKATARGRAHRQHRNQRQPPRTATERVNEEIFRVCEPFGLNRPGHHLALMAAAASGGIQASLPPTERQSARAAFSEWRGRELLNEPLNNSPSAATFGSVQVQHLAIVIRGLFDLWIRQPAATTLRQTFGELSAYPLDVPLACRLWDEFHRHERELSDLPRRRDLLRALNTAVGYAVPQAVQDAFGAGASSMGSRLDGSGNSQETESDESADHPFERRLQRTAELLLRHDHAADVSHWQEAAVRGDDSWKEHYVALVRTHTGGPASDHPRIDELISADELEQVMRTDWMAGRS